MQNIGVKLQIDSADSAHRFLQFGSEPVKGLTSEATLLIIKHYLGKRGFTRAQWKKENRKYNVNWQTPKGEPRQSVPINYRSIGAHLREKGYFNPDELGLGPMECFWMDVSFPVQMTFHMADETGTLTMAQRILQQQYGEDFPIKLDLQREGHMYGSLQPQLVQRIIRLRNRLIENSQLAMDVDWFFDLRTLIGDTISMIDITLNQAYIKAEYDLPVGWSFDPEKLGERHGQRLRDKLKWVYKLTGRFLNIQQEQNSLDTLREIRNHLEHLDPPCVIITFEEAAIWLNHVIDVAMIAIKIRKALGVEISSDLINLILQKEAVFVPVHAGQRRKPLSLDKDEDYYSSTWPPKIEN